MWFFIATMTALALYLAPHWSAWACLLLAGCGVLFKIAAGLDRQAEEDSER